MGALSAAGEATSLSSPVTWGRALLLGTWGPAPVFCQEKGVRVKEGAAEWLAGMPLLWAPDWGARSHPGQRDHQAPAPAVSAAAAPHPAAPEGGLQPSFALRTIPICMTNETVTLAIRLLLGLSTRKAGSFRN